MFLRRVINAIRRRHYAEGGYRELAVLAVPLILTTASWSIEQFIDRIFLTWHSPEAVAAALPSGMLNFALMSFFMGTTMYVETFVAQYFGAGRHERIGPSFWQGIYVAILGGLVLLIAVPFAKPIFRAVGHPALVQQYEVTYFQILCFGAMPALASGAMSAFFSGRGSVWPVMWVNVLSTVVNIVLDYVLIFGKFGFPAWGIKGAAIATVLSGVASFLAYLVLLARPAYERQFRTLSGWRFDPKLFKRLLRFGLPNGSQFFLDMASFTAFILLVGRLGTDPLAATVIAFNINALVFMPMLGTGFAVSILVGQYLGRDRPDVAQRAAYSGFQVTFAYTLVFAAAYVLLPGLFLVPYGAEADPATFPAIRAIAVALLRFVAIYSLFDTMNIIFSSAIKGAGDTRFVMLIMIVLAVLALLIPCFIAIVMFHAGIYITWTIATIYYSLLGFAFFFRFLGGKWKKMRVIEAPSPDGDHELRTSADRPRGDSRPAASRLLQ